MADPPRAEPTTATANGVSATAGAVGSGEPLLPHLGSKRQRRPSVRLGDIGDAPATLPLEPYLRRAKHSKAPCSAASSDPRQHPPAAAGPRPPSSKTRPLTTLDDPSSSAAGEDFEPLAVAIRRRSREAKSRRAAGARRARSAWVSAKANDGIDTAADLKSSGEEEEAEEEGFREFDKPRPEAAAARVRVSDDRDLDNVNYINDTAEGDAPSETDGGDWSDQNGRCQSLEDGGVRSWLDRLGLGRYAPVFEIHEVDDAVLPLLTLEDLKDMGINAVGSRRKMYWAIQKLRKELS